MKFHVYSEENIDGCKDIVIFGFNMFACTHAEKGVSLEEAVKEWYGDLLSIHHFDGEIDLMIQNEELIDSQVESHAECQMEVGDNVITMFDVEIIELDVDNWIDNYKRDIAVLSKRKRSKLNKRQTKKAFKSTWWYSPDGGAIWVE